MHPERAVARNEQVTLAPADAAAIVNERRDPQGKLRFWCQMCGAAPGEPCTVISGDPDAGEKPGDVRADPHFYRSAIEKPAVLIPDEPDFANA